MLEAGRGWEETWLIAVKDGEVRGWDARIFGQSNRMGVRYTYTHIFEEQKEVRIIV